MKIAQPGARPAKDETMRIGVSACLVGNPVRYDGGHRLASFVAETLSRHCTVVPVCPEVECGLPVPRETMHLVGDPAAPRLVTTGTGIDHTERLLGWARQRLPELAADDLSGFIFKSRSPSCGVQRVKVLTGAAGFRRVGVGLFARQLMAHSPLVPVEEDDRLSDEAVRENFIERIFAGQRWRACRQKAMHRDGLAAFHASHQLQIMAHSEQHCRALGRLVATAGELPVVELFARYQALLCQALARLATRKKNAKVLQQMAGSLRRMLTAGEKAELRTSIDRYRAGTLPLAVPITLVGSLVRQHGVAALAGQTYLAPHPLEIQLRSHA
ncbi:MAG: DUF523 and DUF1722 domain-containing protein [Thermodesulfobacteriota bacterium]